MTAFAVAKAPPLPHGRVVTTISIFGAGGRMGQAIAQAAALRDDVRETGERYFRQAQDAASDLEEQVSERVRAEPIKSVLIAAAVGYVYARLFR